VTEAIVKADAQNHLDYCRWPAKVTRAEQEAGDVWRIYVERPDGAEELLGRWDAFKRQFRKGAMA